MPIKIPIVADVANAIRGARDVGQEFDKVADTLDDLESNAKDAERALDWGTPDSLEKVEDSTKDATDEMKDLERAAEDTGDKLERKFKEAHEQVEKLGKEDVNIEVDIDKDGKARKSFDNLKEDIGDSANESGQEVAGAFMDGFSGENIVEALTEVLAESTENLSGPFQAAGIAAAAGLALVYAQLAKIAEETNEAKEAGGEWAQSFNTTDLSGRLDALRDKFAAFATEIADPSEWYEFGEAAETALEQIQDGAAEGGVSLREFMDAFNTTDPTERLDKLNAALEKTRGRIDELDAQKASAGPLESWDLANQTRELHEQEDAIKGLVDEQQTAIDTEKAVADAMGLSVDQLRDYNELTDEAKERVDAAADSQKDYALQIEKANEEIREQNDLNRDALEADLDLRDALAGLKDQVDENGTSLSRNTEKGRENIRYLIDAAESIDDLYDAVLAETGSQEQAAAARDKASRELRQQAIDAGYSEREVDKLLRTINRTPKSKTTDINVNTKQGERDIREFVNRDPGDVGVGVYADTSRAQQDVASFRYMVQATPLQMILRAA
jgi:chromosome segregation ATPase